MYLIANIYLLIVDTECVVVSNVTLPNSPTAEAAERTRNLLYEALNAPIGNFDWLSTQRPNTQLSINENGDPVQPVNEHRPRFSHQISEKVNINPHVREAHMSVGLKIGERVIVGGLKVMIYLFYLQILESKLLCMV